MGDGNLNLNFNYILSTCIGIYVKVTHLFQREYIHKYDRPPYASIRFSLVCIIQ